MYDYGICAALAGGDCKQIAYKSVPSSFGKPTGYVLAEQKLVAETLLRVSFIEKREKRPLRWEFVFYKPAANWRLIGFVFDGNIQYLLNALPAGAKR